MDSHGSSRDRRTEEFLLLFQQHERQLYGYILSLVPNIASADDISQNTNLRLWEQFDQFDPNKDFGAWARAIAYYQVLAYRKTVSRERVRFNSELLQVLSERVSAQCKELDARQSHLMDCLAKLSEFAREMIRSYYCSGMTAKAVAEKLGRSAAAIEKALVRTRRTLHDCVEAAVRRENHS